MALPARQLHQCLLRHSFFHPIVRHLPQTPIVATQSKQRLRIPIPLLFFREQPSHSFEHESIGDFIRMSVFFFAGFHESSVCQIERSSFLHFRPVRRCARGNDRGVAGSIRSTFPYTTLVHCNLTVKNLSRPQIMTTERLRLGPIINHLVVYYSIRSHQFIPRQKSLLETCQYPIGSSCSSHIVILFDGGCNRRYDNVVGGRIRLEFDTSHPCAFVHVFEHLSNPLLGGNILRLEPTG
mmetsp:Transcript_34038/g.62603  ORF Transcript_34038/g.62603 Transcript_34038/m.62603 type:complete len:238 (-) Transcript_34038:987-1700(-)